MPGGRSRGTGRFRIVGLAAATTMFMGAMFASSAQAATIAVTNNGDGVGKCPSATECTLRKAIETASQGDTISLGAATYTLAGEPLRINKNIAIIGAGSGSTTLTSAPASELIYLEEAELDISGISFKGGAAPPRTYEYTESGKKIVDPGYFQGEGGAIYNAYGILKVNGCAFAEDIAKASTYSASYGNGGDGGAIYNDGKTVIVNSTFTGDTAEGDSHDTESDRGGYGGAIYNDYGDLSISSSAFSGSSASGGTSVSAKYNDGGFGGAIYSASGSATITASSFNGNVAGGGAISQSGTRPGENAYGGALYLEETATTVSDSTFSGNTAGSGADAGSAHGPGGYGGGIYNDNGSITVSGSAIADNTAAATYQGGEGGGFYSYGGATIERSTVTSNKSPDGYGGGLVNGGGHISIIESAISENEAEDAGGIYAEGSTGVRLSTISGNKAVKGYGGGIYNNEPELELAQSTVSGNAAEYGGGIYNDAPLGAVNSTIAQNTATEEGGGIYNDSIGSLANVTLYGNAVDAASSGGNLYLEGFALTLHDTLIAAGVAPTSDGNCAFGSGAVVSKGYNAEDSNQCQLDGPGDQVNVALSLSPLASNGGPTQTVALLPGSAAIDKGDPLGCAGLEGELLSTDQRNVARPQDGRCDVGAFELVPPAAAKPEAKPEPKPTPAPRDTSMTITPSAFAPTSGKGSIAKRHKRKKHPKGTTIGYTDSEAATTTFTVVRLEHGYRVGKGLCKVASKHAKAPKHRKPCTHEVTLAGSFAHLDTAGHNQFVFSGHVDGRKLSKGSYVLIAQPRLGSLTGPTVSVAFKIV
jgi:Chlamydia polymorphic membrane protein (Chlamydia_PMP) repeat